MTEEARISSIDEVLMNAITGAQQPKTPEHHDLEAAENVPHETSAETSEETVSDEYGLEAAAEPESQREPEQEPIKEANLDDYGNEVAKPKKYTEEEVNERINIAVRERLARMERNQQSQPTQQQAQAATQQGFEYDSGSDQSWQQQLEAFVESTVSKMSHKQAQAAQQQREQAAHIEFETKFQQGMKKFADYVDVVQSQPITDAMTMAARSMKDPAAFFYAAAKRAPQELQRIANIADPYAQIAEIGKLEERMKQQRPSTKAPRPVTKVQADMTIAHNPDKKELTIEQMIAQSDARRQAKLNASRRR